MRRFSIFIILLCFLFFNCSDGCYGNFLVSYNDYHSGIIFNGVDADVNTETFYIPETIYGIPVVGIKIKKNYVYAEGRIYAKHVIVPKSVTSIDKDSFSSKTYPSLKTIIIKGTIEDLDGYAFYDSNVSYTIVLYSATPPKVSNIRSGKNLEFYVSDESVDKYKNATGWSKFASSIYPLSKYPGTLP